MRKIVTLPSSERAVLHSLFSDHRHLRTCIDAVLQGFCGEARADSIRAPKVAQLSIGPIPSGTYLTFLGGDSQHPFARSLLHQLPRNNLVWLSDYSWLEALRTAPFGPLEPIERYSFSSDSLNRTHALSLASQIPKGFAVERIDIEHARRVNAELQASPITVEFNSPSDFVHRGIGFCAARGQQIVCAATTGSMCEGNIEIQVDTAEAFRRRGLASAVCAKLIVQCLDDNIVPHWDADNDSSVKLAEKLGFTFVDSYEAYYISPG